MVLIVMWKLGKIVNLVQFEPTFFFKRLASYLHSSKPSFAVGP